MKRLPTGLALVALACTFGLLGGGITVYVRSALASRNSAGTYSLANSPVTTLQTISTSLWNNQFNDLATAVTDSLDRNGRGGMLAALRGIDGTVAAPALSFTSETGSGWYRIGASDLGLAISGTKKLELTSSLFTVTPTATLSGGLADAASGNKVLQVGVTFPLVLLGSNPGVGFNTYFDGSNNKYVVTNFGGQIFMDSSGNLITYTAPSGTAGNTATLTERMRIATGGAVTLANGLTVTGALAQGSSSQLTADASGNFVTTGTFKVGSGSVSTVSGFTRGGCTLNGASPSTCTFAALSGQTCVASFSSTGAPPASGLRTNNVSGTVTVTGANGLTDGANIVCF